VAQPTEQIRDFLCAEANWEGARAELTDDLPLIDGQVIDSMMLLRLVAWLTSEYQIAIDDADVVPSNFGTIERIASLVEAKLAS
jgi:acyl carrier protein